MLNQVFTRRFQELVTNFASIQFHHSDDGFSRFVEQGDWKRWSTSAQNLIQAVFGKTSPHYENFTQAFKDCRGYDQDVLALRGIFLSAKDDFDGGYVFNVDLRVSGEVFGDFITLSKQALTEGHKNVAAVLSCAALEDALKRFATANGLNVENNSMQEVVNALKSQGLVSGAQKSLLDAMPKIRNQALHADWDKLSEPDVNSVIGFVEQFLLTNFSA